MKEKVIFNWSSGKDSALCLYKMLQSDKYEIQCLLTSVNDQYDRISMHGVRTVLLEAQAKSLGLPLVQLRLPEMPSMEIYENQMASTLSELKINGATISAFGDIFLEDLRKYREDKLAQLDLKGLFPLWKQPTDQLIKEFIDLGFKAIITCVNDKYLDQSFVGRIIDEQFIKDLPENVDPCGENGEFHSFVFDGPIFKEPIAFEKGEIVHKKYEQPKNDDDSNDVCKSDSENPFEYGFWYCDLIQK